MINSSRPGRLVDPRETSAGRQVQWTGFPHLPPMSPEGHAGWVETQWFYELRRTVHRRCDLPRSVGRSCQGWIEPPKNRI